MIFTSCGHRYCSEAAPRSTPSASTDVRPWTTRHLPPTPRPDPPRRAAQTAAAAAATGGIQKVIAAGGFGRYGRNHRRRPAEMDDSPRVAGRVDEEGIGRHGRRASTSKPGRSESVKQRAALSPRRWPPRSWSVASASATSAVGTRRRRRWRRPVPPARRRRGGAGRRRHVGGGSAPRSRRRRP